MGRTRRKLSSEEKLKMVMAVIQDGKAVSDVAQENNVHVILEAFSEMLDETLVFVGNWEKSEEEGLPPIARLWTERLM